MVTSMRQVADVQRGIFREDDLFHERHLAGTGPLKKILLVAERQKEGLFEGPVYGPPDIVEIRITSYNVCYTKLLRLSG